MELDLDSFLNSRPDIDDDDEDEENSTSLPCRTVDEILNDSLCESSSSSSAAGSRPSSPVPSSTLHEDDPVLDKSREALKVPPPDVEESVSSDFHPRPSPRAGDPLPRLRPPDPVRKPLTAASGPASASRHLPPLFGGVRSSAKPGAALAAAVAASRTVPTPHAAAIKSRRALLGRPSLDASTQLHSSASSASSSSNENSFDSLVLLDERIDTCNGKLHLRDEHGGGGDDSIGDFQSAAGDCLASRELLDAEAEPREAKEDDKDFSSSSLPPEDLVAAPGASTGSANTTAINAENSISDHTSLTPAATVLVSDERVSEVVDNKEEDENAEDEVFGDSEDKDPEIDKLVEERIGRIGQLESERMSEKKPEKVKPLDLAEQAERRQASTALHWEEGVAAQPMRLEGVRRGSTSLGYFDIDAANVISQTLSSQAFIRDHGSPQALAVHANYIAVGMSKGIIILLPSKYSPHQPDNMEGRVFKTLFLEIVFALLPLML